MLFQIGVRKEIRAKMKKTVLRDERHSCLMEHLFAAALLAKAQGFLNLCC